MKISFPQQEDPATIARPALHSRVLRTIAAVFAALLIVLIVLALLRPEALLAGATRLEERWGAAAFQQDRSLAGKWSIVLGGFFRSRLDDIPEIPDLVIDVPFEGISKIYQKREAALALGHLVQADDDFVNGDIRLADRTIAIKLRLKGDWNDHLQGRKWSFRIRVRDGDHLLGMRRFSIQHPITRGFQAELLYFEVLSGLGLMTPRYQFVNVTLNGEPVGLMALEEFFAKELLENRQRREGVIVRFDESLAWNARDSLSGESVGWNGSFDDYRNAAIDGIGSTKIAESETLTQQFRTAQGLLKGFADARLSAAEVFDARQLGRFIAATDVMGAWHATRWANLRFYLNPVSLKLEPIAFDANLQESFHDARSIVNGEPILIDMLRDPLVWRAYLATLELLAGLAREGVLQTNLRAVEAAWLPLLQTEFRMLGEYPLEHVLARAEALHTGMTALAATGAPALTVFLPFETRLYPVLAHFEIQQRGAAWILQIESAIPRAVTVTGIDWVNDGLAQRRAAVASALPLQIPSRGIGAMGQRLQLTLLPAPAGGGWELETLSRISGRSWQQSSRPGRAEAALEQSPLPSATAAEQLQQHDFLSLDVATRTLQIAAGDWQVTSTLVVAPGYSLRIDAGTTLRFAADAALVSYGPVAIAGTAEAPVALLPANDESWPGLVVMNAAALSTLTHVIVSRTHGVALGAWRLSGGANFYSSDVQVDNCRFLNSRGEDALNIIHSTFEIYDTWFKETASDAFDADFSRGSITSSRFEDIGSAGGGDAIDISGSIITVDSVTFTHIADKALSVGERSELRANDIRVSAVGTGVAAKDGSLVILSDSQIVTAEFAALTAYIKKPEYGPARLLVERVQISASNTPVIVQTGSQVIIDGEEVATEDVDVDALYETIMRPGLR